MAFSAIMAALRALTPAWGAPPAWEARPLNWMRLATMPLLVPPMAILPSSLLLEVWVIIARSTSSSAPRRMNSGLPPRNSSLPSLRRSSRNSISMYSSAGTAMSATRPARSSMTPEPVRPAATASIMPIWQWWPQACAAVVSGSAWGWPSTLRESNSPMTATVGPEKPPFSMPLSPVMPMPSS